jgi:hypothetical protein
MKIVKFKDDSYGIRRFSWDRRSYEYLDLEDCVYWWSSDYRYKPYCRKATRQEVLIAYEKATDYGTPV